MYAVTDKFLEAIRYTGDRKTVVDLYPGTGATPILRNLPVVSGSISVDRTSDNRRSGSVVIGDSALLRTLEPWGIEFGIRMGVVYPGGAEELVPLGRFRIEEEKWKEGANSNISITFFDRTQALSDTRHLTDKDYSGKLARNIVQEVLDASFPFTTGGPPQCFVSSDLPNYDLRLPGGSTYDGTHWETIKKIAEALGGEAFFDLVGDLHVVKTPSLDPYTDTNLAVWTVDAGEGGVMVSADRGVSRSDTYNGVAVYGANATEGKTRVYAAVYDTTPNSPTNYNSWFGKKTIRVENQALTTVDQCYKSAIQLLKNYGGLSRSVDFQSLANVALDVGDIVIVRYLDSTQELHIIDSMSIALGGGAFTCHTRAIQYVV